MRVEIAECDVCGKKKELAVFDDMFYHDFSIGVCADCIKLASDLLGTPSAVQEETKEVDGLNRVLSVFLAAMSGACAILAVFLSENTPARVVTVITFLMCLFLSILAFKYTVKEVS